MYHGPRAEDTARGLWAVGLVTPTPRKLRVQLAARVWSGAPSGSAALEFDVDDTGRFVPTRATRALIEEWEKVGEGGG